MKTGWLTRIKLWGLAHPAILVGGILLVLIISLNFFLQMKKSPTTSADKHDVNYPNH